ncbi:MAG: class I SAM-dependent methyltransferase [Candidatus Thorarchaeota archaeon]
MHDKIPSYIHLPKGYHLIGHVVLLQLNSETMKYAKAIGEVVLDYNHRIKSVAVRTGPTNGITRKPNYTLVAGSADTVTTHLEDGVKFRLDPLKITFSGGNRSERIRFPDTVKQDEIIVDMFACVGQFGLHIAKKRRAKVIAIEINQDAYSFLIENIKLNQVESNMTGILGDCREVIPINKADRVIMGYLHNTADFLPSALETLSSEGGWIHMHISMSENERMNIGNTINTLCEAQGYKPFVTFRKIKHYSPGVVHNVYDIRLERK